MATGKTDVSSKDFLLKKLRPVLYVLAGLFLFSAVVLPLCIAFHLDVVLYLLVGVLSLGVLVLAYFLIRLNLRYAKELESSLKMIDQQLDDFSHGHRGFRVMIAEVVFEIGFFNFYVSIAEEKPFFKRFLLMVLISLGVAAISFGIGVLAKLWLGIEVQ